MIPLILLIGVWIVFLFPPIIFIVPIIIGLFKILSKVFDNIIHNIIEHIDSPEYQKEKWIKNLKNGKRVNIGDSTIKCKNDILTINGINFYLNEIYKLELTYKIVSVSKTTIDRYVSVWNSSLCYSPEVITKDYELTVEEYKNDIALTKAAEEESKERPNVYYDSLRYKYKYKFNKQYYISTIFYDGKNKLFPIAYCANCDNEGPNAPYEESLVLELNNHINSLKIQKHL